MNPRRLYRCRQDRQIAGVAGGMAEYLDVDPTVVRILWILSVLFGGFTILLYIILTFVIPLEPAVVPASGSGSWAGSAPASDGSAVDPTAIPDADGVASSPQWPAHAAWTAPAGHDRGSSTRGSGRAGFVFGVLLVVFGAIALVSAVIPGLIAGAALGPAFVLALGVALLVGATRRPADVR